MSTIDSVRLHDYDERFAPPEAPVLDIALVGDCMHLTISKYDETYETTETSTIGQIAVDVEQLLGAIVLLATDQEKQAIKADIPFQERYVQVVP